MEWLLFVTGAAAVGVSLALGYRERRDFARMQEKASRTRPGDLEEISLVVADLEQELTETAERIVSELEERAATLRRLITEARAVASDLGVSEAPPAEEASGSGGPPDRLAPGSKGWRGVEAKVWELSQHGLGVEQIARQLDIGKGEVKLILDLRKAQAR